MTTLEFLSLNCWVSGDNPKKVFTVKVPKSENVAALQYAIKENHLAGDFTFKKLSAKDLNVWAVAIPLDDGEVDTREAKKVLCDGNL